MFKVLIYFFIGISLSMDAFTLSLSIGTTSPKKKNQLLLSILIGSFHFFMPIIGNKIGNIFQYKSHSGTFQQPAHRFPWWRSGSLYTSFKEIFTFHFHENSRHHFIYYTYSRCRHGISRSPAIKIQLYTSFDRPLSHSNYLTQKHKI